MFTARRWWVMSLILVTREAEIRRIEVHSQCRQVVHKYPSQKCPTEKRIGRVAQVVECLPSNHET
jgi:hypothetical protein